MIIVPNALECMCVHRFRSVPHIVKIARNLLSPLFRSDGRCDDATRDAYHSFAIEMNFTRQTHSLAAAAQVLVLGILVHRHSLERQHTFTSTSAAFVECLCLTTSVASVCVCAKCFFSSSSMSHANVYTHERASGCYPIEWQRGSSPLCLCRVDPTCTHTQPCDVYLSNSVPTKDTPNSWIRMPANFASFSAFNANHIVFRLRTSPFIYIHFRNSERFGYILPKIARRASVERTHRFHNDFKRFHHI